MTIERNYIFANDKAYSIFATVSRMATHYAGEHVDENARILVDTQYADHDPEFLLDLMPISDDNDGHMLVFLDIWLAQYGVEVNIDGAMQDVFNEPMDEDSIQTYESPELLEDHEYEAVEALLELRDGIPAFLRLPTFEEQIEDDGSPDQYWDDLVNQAQEQ